MNIENCMREINRKIIDLQSVYTSITYTGAKYGRNLQLVSEVEFEIERLRKIENILKKFEKWVDALRSGNHKQATGFLYEPDPKRGDGFCCLGVFAFLEGAKTVEGENGLQIGKKFCQDTLSHSFVKNHMMLDTSGGFEIWKVHPDYPRKAELERMFAEENQPDCYNHTPNLATLNDEFGWSFEEIADFIEQNPLALMDIGHDIYRTS